MNTQGHNRLATLAATAQHEHHEAQAAAKKALEHALNAGDALVEAKVTIPHGQWADWLSRHVPAISGRTAQLYMKLARNRDKIDAQRVADLSLRQAAKLAARPKWEAMQNRFDRIGLFTNGFVAISPDTECDRAHVAIV